MTAAEQLLHDVSEVWGDIQRRADRLLAKLATDYPDVHQYVFESGRHLICSEATRAQVDALARAKAAARWAAWQAETARPHSNRHERRRQMALARRARRWIDRSD